MAELRDSVEADEIRVFLEAEIAVIYCATKILWLSWYVNDYNRAGYIC